MVWSRTKVLAYHTVNRTLSLPFLSPSVPPNSWHSKSVQVCSACRYEWMTINFPTCTNYRHNSKPRLTPGGWKIRAPPSFFSSSHPLFLCLFRCILLYFFLLIVSFFLCPNNIIPSFSCPTNNLFHFSSPCFSSFLCFFLFLFLSFSVSFFLSCFLSLLSCEPYLSMWLMSRLHGCDSPVF